MCNSATGTVCPLRVHACVCNSYLLVNLSWHPHRVPARVARSSSMTSLQYTPWHSDEFVECIGLLSHMVAVLGGSDDLSSPVIATPLSVKSLQGLPPVVKWRPRSGRSPTYTEFEFGVKS